MSLNRRQHGISMSRRAADDGFPALGNAMGLRFDDGEKGLETVQTTTRRSTTYHYSSNYDPASDSASAAHSRSTSTTTSSTTLYTTTSSTLSLAFSELSAVASPSRSEEPKITNASDSEADGDETERVEVRSKASRRLPSLANAAVPDESDIDGEINLCEVIDHLTRPSQLQPQPQASPSSHKRKLAAHPVAERQQRPRRHTHIPSASTYPTFAPEYVPELDESLPYIVRRVLPWFRIVLLGWIFALTMAVIGVCVAFGLARGVWNVWTAWKVRRRPRVQPASSQGHSLRTILITFALALVYTGGNIGYKLWKLWREWQSASKQRCVTRSPGRGGQHP